MKFFKKWLVISFAALAVAGLSGCNTFEGVGEDVEDAGEKIQDAAD